ncbi:MAG: hypothetical protein Kow0074_21840 [Candidatus Zixiibacteriota bacterium]
MAFGAVADGLGIDAATLRLVDLGLRDVVDFVVADADCAFLAVIFLLLLIDLVFPEVVDLALRVRLDRVERAVWLCFLGIFPPVGTVTACCLAPLTD